MATEKPHPTPRNGSSGSPRAVALQEAFASHYPRLCAFFLRRGFSLEESRDLAQDTFLRAFEKLETLRSEETLEGWLWCIAANLWRNTLRYEKAAKRDADEVPLDEATVEAHAAALPGLALAAAPPANPLDHALDGERNRLVYEAFCEMPPQMRRCMQLHVGEELKYREVAEALNISINTVKTQIHRAKAHLETRLAAHFQPLPHPLPEPRS